MLSDELQTLTRVQLVRRELQPQELQPQELQPQELQPQELQPQELQPQELQPQELQPQELMAASQRAPDEQNEREERSAGATLDDEKDVIIHGATHYTEVLYSYTSTTRKCSLAVDYEYNYLYIAVVDTAPVILNLNTNEHIPYVGRVKYARSVSVDQETHELYIGASDGIYKYKPRSGEERVVGAAGVSVWHVYFNGVLYYTGNHTDKVSTLINGHSVELVDIQRKVHNVVIDNEHVVFFKNKTRLYSQKMDSGHTTLYYKGFVNNLAVDRTCGRVYFATKDGIYEIIKYNVSYRKEVSIKGVEAIAFDKNDYMICSVDKKVYRLKPKADVNITNTMNIIKQMETKLDIMDKKMDKLENDHVEMQKSMSQKIDKLETEQVKILNSVTNISTLITDIAERLSVIGKQGQNK